MTDFGSMFGSANTLDIVAESERRAITSLGQYDPATLAACISISEVRENLFPLLRSGVRFWPFLIFAHEHRESSATEATRALTRIRAEQRRQQKAGRLSRLYGPGRSDTLAPYRSVYNRIVEAHGARDSRVSPMYRFITDGRRQYRGDNRLFSAGHTKQWQKALRRSMAPASQQYACALGRYKSSNASARIDAAIADLIRNGEGYDFWLRKGAACYAFLRCVYGEATVEGIEPHDSGQQWARTLLDALADRSDHCLSPFRGYIPLIKRARGGTPLKHIHGVARERNRRVLASLGFQVFYNLYVNTEPQGVS